MGGFVGGSSSPSSTPEFPLGTWRHLHSHDNIILHFLREPQMHSLHVNGFDMPYLDIGEGPPLVCVHGSLCDFRIWSAVLGPLTCNHRVIAVSLRHFFPAHWDGVGDTYSIAQHVDDVIAFLEAFDTETGRPDGTFPAAAISAFAWRSGGRTCCAS